MLLTDICTFISHQLGMSFRSQRTTRTLKIMTVTLKTNRRMDWTRRKMTRKKSLMKKMTTIMPTAATPSACLPTVKPMSDQQKTQLATGTIWQITQVMIDTVLLGNSRLWTCWHLRKLRTLIDDNHSDLTNNSEIGQDSQFFRCN